MLVAAVRDGWASLAFGVLLLAIVRHQLKTRRVLVGKGVRIYHRADAPAHYWIWVGVTGAGCLVFLVSGLSRLLQSPRLHLF